jgi:glycosyltransferase involved in cell wall biosynthesis
MKEKPSWILFMSSFPPRECGIATFTKALTTAIENKFPKIKTKILALNRNGINIYNYPENVLFSINDSDVQEYINAAKRINSVDSIKLVNIQHEFGIYGGKYGNYLIPFLEVLEKPVVITLHSVLPNPDEKLKNVVISLAKKATSIVVMTDKAIEILRKDYGIKTDIVLIPHGIPDVEFTPAEKEKKRIGLQNRFILSSFGLVGPSKGYEYVIQGLPEVVKKFPNLLYIIAGETHPIIRKKEGEKYRNLLEKMIKKLGLKDNVKFYNKYMRLDEIIKYLQLSDIYISSGTDPNQITSGTLAYAMGVGKAVISTPFLHAKDILKKERGLLAKFKNPESYSKAIIKLLTNPELRHKIEKNAYKYTRHMTWPNVAVAYMNVYNRYIGIFEHYDEDLPRIKLDHLQRLTDSFGIIQFAKKIKPDTDSGYTLDDNARAMIVAAMHYNIFRDATKLQLIKIYLDFIKYVQQNDGTMYNYVLYDRTINYKNWTDDAHGRALWALGYLTSVEAIPEELKQEAALIFSNGLKIINKLEAPRCKAFAILGLHFFNLTYHSKENKIIIQKLADHIVKLYEECSSEEWQWFEKNLTYCNSKLPEALFYAYLATRNEKYLEVAKATLKFLISTTTLNDRYAPIGNKGWYEQHNHKAYFDQQPVDTASMVQTLMLAHTVTKREKYMRYALITFGWFLGHNALNLKVYDESSGGCFDGVRQTSVNQNQGAESTISYLIARLTLAH